MVFNSILKQLQYLKFFRTVYFISYQRPITTIVCLWNCCLNHFETDSFSQGLELPKSTLWLSERETLFWEGSYPNLA